VLSYKLSANAEVRLQEERHSQQFTVLTDRNREHLREWLAWVDTSRTVEELTTTHVLQPYCNQDDTLRYSADTVDIRCRRKCCKMAELPDTSVLNVMRDAELTRRRSLVRTQHRPLRNPRRYAEYVEQRTAPVRSRGRSTPPLHYRRLA